MAIPTMQVQELNNEFNTPLDMVKVVVERHKPYHSADITVEQRAFQVTEKVIQSVVASLRLQVTVPGMTTISQLQHMLRG